MPRKILKSVNFEAECVAVEVVSLAPDSPPIAETNNVDPASNADSSVDIEAALAAAQEQTEIMLNQAQAQIAVWQEQAHQQGWEEGYAEGYQAIQAEMNETLSMAQALAQAALEAKTQFLCDNQGKIGELAIAIAKKIIGKELMVNQKAISDIVGRAIEAANIHGACTIRVNPHDFEILKPLWDAIPSMQHPSQKWELVVDKHVSSGGCLIVVGGGVVDAQLETQLSRIASAFEEVGRSDSQACG
ncbi:MAG: FliH/SctL family protein [Chloroflexota bacterium]